MTAINCPQKRGNSNLAIVLDVFSRRVVGWSMTHPLRTELVLGALNMALGQRRPDGVVHHSDREYVRAGSLMWSDPYREQRI